MVGCNISTSAEKGQREDIKARDPSLITNEPKRGLHQTYSYLKDIVLQRKVREAIPEAACARLGLLPRLKQMLAGVIDFELRHFRRL